MRTTNENEPAYPKSAVELEDYCDRLIASLLKYVPDQLVCVLLCGSWARGGAKPPDSDADLAVILDAVDDTALARLRLVWSESKVGLVNVYGSDEVPLMPRDALEFYTTNAQVLWGTNPFPLPGRQDFAADLARAAESVMRYARSILIYPWVSQEEIEQDLTQLLGKYEIVWALRCLVAYRKGDFPENWESVRHELGNTPEERVVHWLDTLSQEERLSRSNEIAVYLNTLARSWMNSIASSAFLT